MLNFLTNCSRSLVWKIVGSYNKMIRPFNLSNSTFPNNSSKPVHVIGNFKHRAFTYVDNASTLQRVVLNPKGLGNGITIHPFGTPRRGQVSLFEN